MNVGKCVVTMLLGIVLAAPSAKADSNSIAVTAGSAALLGLLCYATRSAPEDDSFARRGWFASLAGVYGHNFKDDEERDLHDELEPFDVTLEGSDGRGGINASVGYRCNRWTSAELGLEWLADIDREVRDSVQGEVATSTVSPLFVSTNAKGYLLPGRFQPYVIIGAGSLNIEATTVNTLGPKAKSVNKYTNIAIRMGGGLDFYATKHFVLALETSYVLPVTGRTTFKYLSVGAALRYRF